MIKLIQTGQYQITQSDDNSFIELDGGNKFMLMKQVTCANTGEYKLYHVKDEPTLVDLSHLDISGENMSWQGFVIPHIVNSSVPDSKIMPTQEVITNNAKYKISE